MYVVDEHNGLQKLSPHGKLLWSVAIPSSQPYGRIAVDPWGSIYLTEDEGIIKLSPAGRVLAHWRGGKLAKPGSLAMGGHGNLFALYSNPPASNCGAYCFRNYGARIEKLSPQGRVLATWYTDEAGFDQAAPGNVAVDPSGSLYVTFSASSKCYREGCSTSPNYELVHKLSPAGQLVARWGGKNTCCHAIAMAVDTQANVYLAGQDWSDGAQVRVAKFSSTGRMLARWGEPGRCGPTQFGGLLSLAVDRRGTIYVGDGPGLIHVLASDGTPRSMWGTCDGGPPRPLRSPGGVALDTRGTVYVVNRDPHGLLSEFLPSGLWLAQWGDPLCDTYPDAGK